MKKNMENLENPWNPYYLKKHGKLEKHYSNNRRIMRTENSKIRKFCPRSETCKNFTAQLPVVTKLRAFEVCRQNLMFLWFSWWFHQISSKFLEILKKIQKICQNSWNYKKLQKNPKWPPKSQSLRLWANISPSSDGVE